MQLNVFLFSSCLGEQFVYSSLPWSFVDLKAVILSPFSFQFFRLKQVNSLGFPHRELFSRFLAITVTLFQSGHIGPKLKCEVQNQANYSSEVSSMLNR